MNFSGANNFYVGPIYTYLFFIFLVPYWVFALVSSDPPLIGGETDPLDFFEED